MLVTLAIGAASFCCLGIALTAAIPSEDAAPAITNVAVLPLYFLSGVFIPESEIPDGVLQVADLFPIRHFFEAFFAAWDPGDRAAPASSGATSRSSRPGASPGCCSRSASSAGRRGGELIRVRRPGKFRGVIHHVSVEVSDLERSGRFYDAVLGALGWRRHIDDDERDRLGDRAAGVLRLRRARPAARRRARLLLRRSGIPAVKAAWEGGVSAGGTDDGAPGPRPEYGAQLLLGLPARPRRTPDRDRRRQRLTTRVRTGGHADGEVKVGNQRLRADRAQPVPRRLRGRRGARVRRRQRHHRRRARSPTCSSTTRSSGRFPGEVEASEARSSSTAHEIKVLVRARPGRPALGRPRRRGRDRVDRAVHQARRRRQAPRGRGEEGDHLGAGDRPRRHRRPRRQLRRRLRPRAAPHHLQRLLHDQLPGARWRR